MPASRLDHYNIWTNCFAATMDFYTRVLGLKAGPRPPTLLAGAWLYDDSERPVVHLVDVPATDAAELEKAGGRDPGTLTNSGAIDHVAFDATDYEDMCKRLQKAGITYREDGIPAINLRQLFVPDPNNIVLELNFRN